MSTHTERAQARAARRAGERASNPQPEVEGSSEPDLGELTVSELRAFAEDLGVTGRSRMNKTQLVEAIRSA